MPPIRRRLSLVDPVYTGAQLTYLDLESNRRLIKTTREGATLQQKKTKGQRHVFSPVPEAKVCWVHAEEERGLAGGPCAFSHVS